MLHFAGAVRVRVRIWVWCRCRPPNLMFHRFLGTALHCTHIWHASGPSLSREATDSEGSDLSVEQATLTPTMPG